MSNDLYSVFNSNDTVRLIYCINEDGSVEFKDGEQELWDLFSEGGLHVANVLKDAEYIKGLGGKIVGFFDITKTYRDYLIAERQQYGDHAVRDELVALGQTIGNEIITYGFGEVGGGIFGGLCGGLPGALLGIAVGKCVFGIYAAEAYDELRKDYGSSTKEFLGNKIRDFYDDIENKIENYLNNLSQDLDKLGDLLELFKNAQGLSTRWALHDPLVMDLDGDGIELINIEESNVYFDIDGDGIAERTGWVKSDDGILVRDINGNGKIDDINELFGNKTVSGIDALKTLDTNNDGKISEMDDDFGSVKVWQDLNGNGISEDGELKSLADLGINGINLNSTNTDETIEGNKITTTTTYTKTDGTIGQVGEVDFLVDQVNTIYRGEYDLNLDTLFFPNSRGYGDLKPLHVAMSEDTVLFGMMKEFTEMSKEDVLSWNETIQNILYRWAGVEGIDSSSRGAEFDAKKLEFLEKFFGESFLSETGYWGTGENNPAGTKACELLEKAWLEIFNIMSTKIIAQSVLKEIIPEESYDFATDKIQINSSFEEITTKTNEFLENMSEFKKLIIGSYVQNILLENKAEFEEENIDTKISELMIEEFGTSAKINYVGKVSDNLYGTESDELFLIGKGSGYKTIIETGGNDSIRLGEGISETDMVLYKNNNDLLIRFKDSEGNLTNDVVKNLKIA